MLARDTRAAFVVLCLVRATRDRSVRASCDSKPLTASRKGGPRSSGTLHESEVLSLDVLAWLGPGLARGSSCFEMRLGLTRGRRPSQGRASAELDQKVQPKGEVFSSVHNSRTPAGSHSMCPTKRDSVVSPVSESNLTRLLDQARSPPPSPAPEAAHPFFEYRDERAHLHVRRPS